MFCLLVPADRVEAADAYGISIAGTTRTVDDGENISATATGVDRAYGANLDTAATLKNNGEIFGTAVDGRGYGANLDNNSVVNNSGKLSGSSQSTFGYGVRADNQSTVNNTGSLVGSSTTHRSYGVYLDENSASTNSGTASATSVSGQALGAYLSNSSVLTNLGSIIAESQSGDTKGVCPEDLSTVDNSGSIFAQSQSGDAYGADIDIASITNSGSIVAKSQSGDAAGVYLNRGTLTNSGSISATGGNSYAIYARNFSNIYLKSGSDISGQVYSLRNTNNLFAQADSNLSFALAGTWDGLTKSGSGVWEMASGSAATANTFNLNSGTLSFQSGASLSPNTFTQTGGSLRFLASGQNAAAAPLKVVGTATLGGTLAVQPSYANLGTSSVLITAGTLDTSGYVLTSNNPNFTAQRIGDDSSGRVTVTTSYTPQIDQSSLVATTTLSSAQAFASMAQARSLALLADAGSKSDDDMIMVASSGSMIGLLDAPSQEAQWGMYLQPVYSSGTRDSDADGVGYDSRMAGMELGIDRHFGDNLFLGLMAGIGAANIDFNGSAFVDNDYDDQRLYTAGLYAGYRLGDWSFADTLSTTYATHDTARNAGLGQTAKADYSSWLTVNQLLALYHWQPSEHWEIAPSAGLNITHLHRGGFSETGAINAVTYNDLNKTFADATLGIRVKYDCLVKDLQITPYAGAGVIQSLGNGDITVRQFLPTSSAQVTTENDSTRLTTEGGVTFGRGNMSLTLAYSGESGKTVDSHSLYGLLRWAF